MNIRGETFFIFYENNVMDISGRLSMMLEDYSGIETFFQQVLASGPETLTLDIRNLEYLNSSGIKVICVNLILEAADREGLHMTIRCSDRYTWQKETVPTFEDLMENMEIVFE